MSGVNLAEDVLNIQRDIHATLSGHEDIEAILGDPARLYDDAPAQPDYPYMTYGQTRSEDTGADAAPQSTHQITLHLWSRQDGRMEALGLLRLISDAIRDGVPHTVVPLYLDMLSAPDGRTFHGLLRLSVTLAKDETP